MKTMKFTALALALLLLFSPSLYSATVDYSFSKLDPNTPESNLSEQLYVSVDDSDPTGALFTFYNVVGIESSITQVVFGDDESIFSGIAYEDSSEGVDFTKSNNLNGNEYKFEKTFSESATGTNNGVNKSTEWISFFGTFSLGMDFDDLLESLLEKEFHIGLHLQSIYPTLESDRYVLTDGVPIPGGFGNPVPLPAAVWLFGPALLGLIGFRKKIKS